MLRNLNVIITCLRTKCQNFESLVAFWSICLKIYRLCFWFFGLDQAFLFCIVLVAKRSILDACGSLATSLEILFSEASTADGEKKFTYIHRKTSVLESLFNKVAGLKASNFTKKRLQRSCFPVYIAKFWRTPSFIVAHNEIRKLINGRSLVWNYHIKPWSHNDTVYIQWNTSQHKTKWNNLYQLKKDLRESRF